MRSAALNVTLLLSPSLTFINGVKDVCPANCLSIFSLVNIVLAVSTACLKSTLGKRTQYNFVGRVFLNTSNIWGSYYPESVTTCLMWFT